MRLADKYRPTTLSEVVGQPIPIQRLQRVARSPVPSCHLLEGPSGCGKTSAAFALASDLGCTDGWMQSVYVEAGADFTAERVRHWFGGESPLRLRAPNGWNVLVIEDLETMTPTVQKLFKDVERRLSRMRAIIVATSNDATGLQRAIRDRFQVGQYAFSAGPVFYDAALERCVWIWEQETRGLDMPLGWQDWGWEAGEFSMRVALDRLEDALYLAREEVAA